LTGGNQPGFHTYLDNQGLGLQAPDKTRTADTRSGHAAHILAATQLAVRVLSGA